MPVVEIQAELSVEQLLEAVRQLSPAELLKFSRQFARLQKQNGSHSEDEASLIRATKEKLSTADLRRLKLLNARTERGTITAEELKEYQALTRKAEQMSVRRVEALAELVRRRGRPARVVMKEIGWESPNDRA
jgi:hypothetical protein